MPTVKKQTTDAEPHDYVLREDIRQNLPDVNDPEVLARIRAAIAELDPEDEAEALRWIEEVSDFEAEGLVVIE